MARRPALAPSHNRHRAPESHPGLAAHPLSHAANSDIGLADQGYRYERRGACGAITADGPRVGPYSRSVERRETSPCRSGYRGSPVAALTSAVEGGAKSRSTSR